MGFQPFQGRCSFGRWYEPSRGSRSMPFIPGKDLPKNKFLGGPLLHGSNQSSNKQASLCGNLSPQISQKFAKNSEKLDGEERISKLLQEDGCFGRWLLQEDGCFGRWNSEKLDGEERLSKLPKEDGSFERWYEPSRESRSMPFVPGKDLPKKSLQDGMRPQEEADKYPLWPGRTSKKLELCKLYHCP
ncbi:hypothetical protein QE152_g35661 [Popillia japonica]|uniref:Uncharacterized protein n=1 Tax=Popillia japonica TaxID=7064 RepID=A0AAW1IFB5_POPJA